MDQTNDPHDDSQRLESMCREAATGNHDALEQLLLLYYSRLAGHLSRKIGMDWRKRIDVDDILQQAYINIFQDISRFEYRGTDSFFHWCVNIVNHRFYDEVRRFKRLKRDVTRELSGDAPRSSGHGALLTACTAHVSSPSLFLRREEAIGALMSCLARLPEHYRVVVTRLYLMEQPLPSVAADLGRTTDAIRRLAGRAIERLAACLGRVSVYFHTREIP